MDDLSNSKNKTGKSKKKKILTIFIPLLLIALVGYSFYIFSLDKFMGEQNTLIFGQNKFSPGSLASFRVITLDHTTQAPIPDAEIEITAQSKEKKEKFFLFNGKTGKNGTANIRFPVPELEEGDYHLIINTRSNAGKDSFKKTIKIERTYKVLLTTDKPIYQPGQTIHIRALALSTLTSKPAANKEITIEVEDAKGNKVFKKKVSASQYGVVGIDFTLANELNLGLYTIRGKIGSDASEKKVTVKRYVLPKFKIGFSTDKTYYLPGQLLKGTISANYFFGKPANNADINVKIYTYEINMQQIANINGKTGANGNFGFEYSLPDSFIGLPLEKGSSLLFFNISVIDQAKHKETVTRSVPIAKDPIEIELIPESGTLEKGIRNIIYVVTTYPDGKPAETTVTVKNKKLNTSRLGITHFRFIPGKNHVSIDVQAEDKQGNKGTKTGDFSTGFQTESLLLRTDKSIYEVGDSIKLDIFCNKKGGTVYVDVIKDKQTILTRAVEVKNKRASIYLDLDETMTGALEIHAYKLLGTSGIVRDSKTIYVRQKKDIHLGISTDKKSYVPGEDAVIRFSTEKNGRPIPAAIGVNIVDESVFALQEKEAGFEKLYFALEKELMEPRYTIYGITVPKMIDDAPAVEPLLRIQAGNLLFAQAPSPDRFLLKAASRVEKVRQIWEKKTGYFKAVAGFFYWLILLTPFLIIGITVYPYRAKGKTLLKEFALSTLILIYALLASISTECSSPNKFQLT